MSSPTQFQFDVARALLAVHTALMAINQTLPEHKNGPTTAALDALVAHLSTLVQHLDEESGA